MATKQRSVPLRNGSGRGTRANRGRGGCTTPRSIGRGRGLNRRNRGR